MQKTITDFTEQEYFDAIEQLRSSGTIDAEEAIFLRNYLH